MSEKIKEGLFNISKVNQNQIETKILNNRQIIAEVDNEDNSLDIAVKIDDEPLVTLNIAVEGNDIIIRKWLGYGDSLDETINIDDVDSINGQEEILQSM